MNVEKYFINRDDSSKAVCAMVFKTTFKEFDQLKERLTESTQFLLIYHKASLEKMFVLTDEEIASLRRGSDGS